MPYCKGLKPRQNYQRILKLIVLDQLDRTPLPPIEPFKILFNKIKEIFEEGAIPVKDKSSGRYGLALESALGIKANSSKTADFMGIELKTKSDKSLQTLFSRTPARYIQGGDKKYMFEQNYYYDKQRDRNALYTSFSSNPDKLGFSLIVKKQVIKVVREKKCILEYDAEDLEAALLLKHSQTMFITLKGVTRDGRKECNIKSVVYCKWPSIIKFLRLIESGDVFLDFTMSEKSNGRILDHGFLWRINSKALKHLYLHSEELDLHPQR